MVNSHVSLPPTSSAATSNNSSSANSNRPPKSKRENSGEKRPESRQSLDSTEPVPMSSSSTTAIPAASTGRRESRYYSGIGFSVKHFFRHVHVHGLPENLHNEKIINIFAPYVCFLLLHLNRIKK